MSKSQQLYTQAVDDYITGNLSKASTLCQKILQKEPKDDKTLNLFGLIQSNSGKIDQAITFFERAVKSNPKNVEAMTNLANAYQSQKQYEKALDIYEAVIKINPDFSKSYYNAAIALREFGDNEQAKALLRKAIELEPSFVDPYVNLSAVFKSENDIEEAIAVLENAPFDERVFSTRALLLSENKEHEEALRQINLAIELKPNHEMLNNLGIILSNAKRHEDAVYAFLQAVSMKNDFDTAYSNMASSFLALKDEQKAKGALLKAINLNPSSAPNYVNLGFYLKKIGDIEGAREAFIRALELDPKNKPAATNLGILLMYLGEFRDGFALYENRTKTLIKTNKPLWGGESLDDKVLFVYHEQGFGDTLNFARLLCNERFLGVDVRFMPQKELCSLFKSSTLPAKIVSHDDVLDSSFDFDCHIPLMSLPHILGVDKAIPKNIQYIRVDESKRAYFVDRLSNAKGKKIGIVWQGNKDYSGDIERSVLLGMFERFLVAGFSLVSLQKEIDLDEFMRFASGRDVYEFTSELNSFSDTAALISSVDCVVSVDTSVAHLAGVLGKDTFLLLPFVPDWRWGRCSDKTEWYDSMTLCRQSVRGVWDNVFDEVFEKISI